MNAKILQISMIAAMAMGNEMYASLPGHFGESTIQRKGQGPQKQSTSGHDADLSSLADGRLLRSASLRDQRNDDRAMSYTLFATLLGGVPSWPEKLSGIFGLGQQFRVYHIQGTDSMERLLPIGETLALIAELTNESAAIPGRMSAFNELRNRIVDEIFELGNAQLWRVFNRVISFKLWINPSAAETNEVRNELLGICNPAVPLAGAGERLVNDLMGEWGDRLLRVYCGENYFSHMGPHDFTAVSFFDSSGLLQCNVSVVGGIEKNQSNSLRTISSRTLSPVLILHISKENCPGERPGEFKDFFTQLERYDSGELRTTVGGGISFDDDIQGQLRECASDLRKGLVWLFVVYDEEIYLICPNGA
jgi:hypothetical protein